MNRLWIALGAYAVLGVLAAVTLEDHKFKLGALAILAMFAVRTLTWHRKLQREQQDESESREREGRE